MCVYVCECVCVNVCVFVGGEGGEEAWLRQGTPRRDWTLTRAKAMNTARETMLP